MAYIKTVFTLIKHNNISRKNDRPLKDARTVVTDTCTVKLERPNISVSKIFSLNLLYYIYILDISYKIIHIIY